MLVFTFQRSCPIESIYYFRVTQEVPIFGKEKIKGNYEVKEEKEQTCFRKMEGCSLKEKEFGVIREDCI